MVESHIVQTIQERVRQSEEEIIRFLREICAIPSMDSQIGPVGERNAQTGLRRGAL